MTTLKPVRSPRPPRGWMALAQCEDRLRRRLRVRCCLDLWELVDELVEAAREDERRRMRQETGL